MSEIEKAITATSMQAPSCLVLTIQRQAWGSYQTWYFASSLARVHGACLKFHLLKRI